MGEVTEMMLDGILCEGCGEVIDMQAVGHPRRCRACRPPISLMEALKQKLPVTSGLRARMGPRAYKAMSENQARRLDAKTRKPHECKACHKLFKTAAGRDHHFGVKHK